MDKHKLRTAYHKKRQWLSEKELVRAGERIWHNVNQTHHLNDANVIHCFFGATSKGEISTLPLLKYTLDNSKRLVMPKMADKNELIHIEVTAIDRLRTNAWGITEPHDGNSVLPTEIDIVFIPALIADIHGHRIGYGRGYYDRFLKDCPALKIILILDSFIIDSIPFEPYDISADMIVTDERIIYVDKNTVTKGSKTRK